MYCSFHRSSRVRTRGERRKLKTKLINGHFWDGLDRSATFRRKSMENTREISFPIIYKFCVIDETSPIRKRWRPFTVTNNVRDVGYGVRNGGVRMIRWKLTGSVVAPGLAEACADHEKSTADQKHKEHNHGVPVEAIDHEGLWWGRWGRWSRTGCFAVNARTGRCFVL